MKSTIGHQASLTMLTVLLAALSVILSHWCFVKSENNFSNSFYILIHCRQKLKLQVNVTTILNANNASSNSVTKKNTNFSA